MLGVIIIFYAGIQISYRTNWVEGTQLSVLLRISCLVFRVAASVQLLTYATN